MSPYKTELTIDQSEMAKYSMKFVYYGASDGQFESSLQRGSIFISSQDREFTPPFVSITFNNGEDSPVVLFETTQQPKDIRSAVEIESYLGTRRISYFIVR